MWRSSVIFTLVQLLLVAQAKIYREGDAVSITVKALSPGGGSFDESLYLYPVDYYLPALGSCGPVNQSAIPLQHNVVSHDIFFGDHLKEAPFNTTFLTDGRRCTLACDRLYKADNVSLINNLIKRNYRVNIFFDDIPVGHESYDFETNKFYVEKGSPLGYLDLDKIPHLFNHFQFIVYYKPTGLNYEILYITVSTQSLTRIPQIQLNCALTPPLFMRSSDYSYNGNRVTYEVLWKELHVNNENKWNIYRNDVVRPFVMNSAISIFFLMAMLVSSYTYITVSRTLIIEKKNALNKVQRKSAGIQELDEYDFSWPALANDVFRYPKTAYALFWLVSQGAQFTVCLFLLLASYMSGHLNLHGIRNETVYFLGSIFTFTLPLYSLLHSYLFRSYKYTHKKLVITLLVHSLTLPIVAYPLINWFNSIHASVESPLHISYDLYYRYASNYAIITLLVFLAGFMYFQPNLRATNEIKKKVPDLPFTFKPLPNMAITGLLPFCVTIIPLSSFYLTLWYNRVFADSTITMAFFIFLVLIVCTTVLNVNYSLSIGNWRWMWFSFFSGASIGIYTFFYSIYLTKWKFGDDASMYLFFLQNLCISSILALIGGSVSFVVSLWFVKKLYTGL
jgi:transmembrane 9 superfamily protein 2/4